MAFVWKPAIFTGGSLVELPKPVTTLGLSLEWDSRESKVPLKAGGDLTGFSRNPMRISVGGEIGKVGGVKKFTEQNMWEAYETLLAAVDMVTDANKFEFFVYHDATSTTYRKFKDVSSIKLDIDVGDEDRVIFPYSLIIIAEDPVIYTTAPGS